MYISFSLSFWLAHWIACMRARCENHTLYKISWTWPNFISSFYEFIAYFVHFFLSYSNRNWNWSYNKNGAMYTVAACCALLMGICCLRSHRSVTASAGIQWSLLPNSLCSMNSNWMTLKCNCKLRTKNKTSFFQLLCKKINPHWIWIVFWKPVSMQYFVCTSFFSSFGDFPDAVF